MTVTYPKMDPEVKAVWVDALRSGEYIQGDHCLHSAVDDAMCCLGVLIDVAVDGFWVLDGGVYSYREEISTLPPSLMRRFGISVDAQDMLIKLNDGYTNYMTGSGGENVKSHTFRGIASWIDKNL